MGRAEFVEPFEQRLLVGQPLDNRFGDVVAARGQLRQVGGGGDPAQRFLGPRLADQFALDEKLQRMGDVGLGPGKYVGVEVADDGRVAPQCEVDGDAEPHGPAADDADGFDIG